jgi:signal peptidase I
MTLERARTALMVLAVVLLGWAWWSTLAPTSVGGPASYVLTQGESMLPTIEPGGLIITRSEKHYEVGDVVAYHNRQLHSVVLHRIVAEDHGRFVLQGDNNDFLDGYRPTPDEVVGKKWLELPGAGGFVRLVQQPIHFALAMALATLLAVRVPRRSRRRRRHHAA